MTYEPTDAERAAVKAKLSVDLPSGFRFSVSHKFDNNSNVTIDFDETPGVKAAVKGLSTDAAKAVASCSKLRDVPDALASVELTDSDQNIVKARNGKT
jgi:hypothetical protein